MVREILIKNPFIFEPSISNFHDNAFSTTSAFSSTTLETIEEFSLAFPLFFYFISLSGNDPISDNSGILLFFLDLEFDLDRHVSSIFRMLRSFTSISVVLH